MATLASSLELFNRKERNLLIREALGHAKEKPLELSPGFCKSVAGELGMAPIPAKAWWATDYHIAWLAGALAVYVEGREQAVAKKTRADDLLDGRRIAEGNQEDVDLVIANGTDLILIEAKGDSAFSNDQLKSKFQRLEVVYNQYQRWVAESSEPRISFYFLLISPTEPSKRLDVKWPTWFSTPGRPWIKLGTFPKDPLRVTRCDAKGSSTEKGDYWRIC